MTKKKNNIKKQQSKTQQLPEQSSHANKQNNMIIVTFIKIVIIILLLVGLFVLIKIWLKRAFNVELTLTGDDWIDIGILVGITLILSILKAL